MSRTRCEAEGPGVTRSLPGSQVLQGRTERRVFTMETAIPQRKIRGLEVQYGGKILTVTEAESLSQGGEP